MRNRVFTLYKPYQMPKLTQKEFDILLNKYLKRQCSPEEEKLVNQWYEALNTAVSDNIQEPTDEDEERLWQSISRKTNNIGEPAVRTIEKMEQNKNHWKWVGIAASVLLFVAIGFYLLPQSQESKPDAQISMIADPFVEPEALQNTDSKMVKPIRLGDGSLVVLQPDSKIEIVHMAQSGNREVKLSGEAFFEIVKDDTRPFLVYSQGIITKVLGTSFNIRARKDDEKIIVDVKTGKVAVFREKDAEEEQYLLTPNQQVIYDRDSDKIIQTLQENPQVIISETEIRKMEFDETSVNTIFEAIEKAYGVDLVFDRDTFSKCQLTTRLSNEGLYERLQIICRALGATYETIGTEVHIRGTECE